MVDEGGGIGEANSAANSNFFLSVIDLVAIFLRLWWFFSQSVIGLAPYCDSRDPRSGSKLHEPAAVLGDGVAGIEDGGEFWLVLLRSRLHCRDAHLFLCAIHR